MTRTCDELGVCNGRHCQDVSACPDYDLVACNAGSCSNPGVCPHAPTTRSRDAATPPAGGFWLEHDVKAECHLPCSAEPRINPCPFAPGVVDGPHKPALRVSVLDFLRATLLQTAVLMAFVTGAGFVGGYVATKLGWLV